ncbi:MAG TPA: hypothetical protein VGK34_00835 [Armatimonadota bacterium]|jgi:hypothetical protein
MDDFYVDDAARGMDLDNRCNIDMNTAREEASWYSIMNVIALAFGSGMGLPIEPSEVNSILNRLGLTMSDLPMKNPSMIQAYFKNGDPHLTKKFEQKNLDSWRWSPDSFDKEFTPQAQGWSIIAQCEAAKWFDIPEKQTAISVELREEWMSDGLLLAAIAERQCAFAYDNLRDQRGLFVTAAEPGSIKVTNPETNLTDQVCMLWAACDVASLTSRQDTAYYDEDAWKSCMASADSLFEAITMHKDSLLDASMNKVQARSISIPALIWYASLTETQDLKAQSLWLVREFADYLVRAQDNNEMVGNTIVDAAAALRALVDAFRITRLRTYADAAVNIFNFIESQWWKSPGMYSQSPTSSEYTFNADDIGTILGALNVSRLFLKERVNGRLAELRMRIFFCNAVDLSGLQMSTPSMDFLPEWLQQREPAIHFRHPAIPLPQDAGGIYGVAPVFAGEVGFDPQQDVWSRRMIFDVSAAMHAACEFIWLNHEAIDGFPEISLEKATVSVRQAVGITE